MKRTRIWLVYAKNKMSTIRAHEPINRNPERRRRKKAEQALDATKASFNLN